MAGGLFGLYLQLLLVELFIYQLLHRPYVVHSAL
jgi:hypothetical protein